MRFTMEKANDFKANVRAIMAVRGWTYDQLGAACYPPRSGAAIRVVLNTGRPRDQTAQIIADALGVKVDRLFEPVLDQPHKQEGDDDRGSQSNRDGRR
jgi:hypothetical protein